MPNLARTRKRLAAAHFPAIAAALKGSYECATRHDAEAILRMFERQFVTHESTAGGLLLWIRDYALEGDERAEGYKGHFAQITITRRKKGGYTLKAQKHWLPLTRHPNRQRPHHPHPDARHPLLRSIQSGREYTRLEDALAVLSALHAQFPRTSIPGGDRLHIAVYTKPATNADGTKTQAITKYLIETIVTPEGSFTLRMTAKPQTTPRKKHVRTTPTTPDDAPTGFFAARESLKRTRRKSPKA